jgi:2-haloalkanoic acid dehalogenase type II
MELTDFKVLSFDCYGTLIDWETGIVESLQRLVARSDKAYTRDQVLEAHAVAEATQEAETPSLAYSDLLPLVYDRIAKAWGVRPDHEERTAHGQSVKQWPAFVDSAAALQYLKKYYKLVILSNVDRESFKASNVKLQVEFDYIFTAQDIGSYKPDLKNFRFMLDRLAEVGIQKNEILHTAESLFHDHLPANRMELASAWIHRRAGKSGHGATHPPSETPHYDFHFASMAEMAKAHQEALRGNVQE